jgi:hypothetical protein
LLIYTNATGSCFCFYFANVKNFDNAENFHFFSDPGPVYYHIFPGYTNKYNLLIVLYKYQFMYNDNIKVILYIEMKTISLVLTYFLLVRKEIYMVPYFMM